NSGFVPLGGVVYSCTLSNCVVAYNFATTNGDGAFASTLVNCTVVSNSAFADSGVYNGTLRNCIVYDNAGSNWFAASLNYCCTVPLPSGPGNFTNAPMLVDEVNGDFRLQSTSPCINSGNNLYVAVTNDLDGNPRLVGGTVDLGACEYQTPTSILSYQWAQQYGLATDGSADYSDADGDGMNNWQEWKSRTDPNDSSSLLKILSVTNAPPGLAVTWSSSS